MSNKKKQSQLNIQISGPSRSVNLNTHQLFNASESSDDSPIDIYMKRNKGLLVKLGELDRDGHIKSDSDSDLYNLFLLGMVSNVESFFRCLIRHLVLLDSHSYNHCLEQQLTFAAAVHHQPMLLPEAILEQCTFISLENIKSSTKNFLDISINKQSNEDKPLVESLKSFEQLCQLRHCIVHRAGLLGSKNAVKLGIEEHKDFLEKPISLNVEFLQQAYAVCLNCVKSYNNFAFNKVIVRYVDENKNLIAWNYTSDRKWFKKYYRLFNSECLNEEALARSETILTDKKAYDSLRDFKA